MRPLRLTRAQQRAVRRITRATAARLAASLARWIAAERRRLRKAGR